MQIVKCTMENLEDTADFYDKVTACLEAHINYPKWIHGEYPARESVRQAILEKSQYICTEKNTILGAFVLNTDPRGEYSAGDWRVNLKEGEFLVIHALATDPGLCRRGLGRQMVDYCVRTAKEGGFRALRLDVVPDNFPARKLYENQGFLFAGEKDLARGIDAIPRFALYELNFEKNVQGMLTVKLYDTLTEEVRRIRTAVFVEEQKFQNEFDDIDLYAKHLVMYKAGEPAAVLRLYPKEDSKEYVIGRVAVAASCRGEGLGAEIVRAAEEYIRKTGGKRITLSAQTRVQEFYEKLGYVCEGQAYFDEYCRHIQMKKTL